MLRQTTQKITALYPRLSHEDELQGEFEGGHAGKWAGICIGRTSHRAIPLCHMGLL